MENKKGKTGIKNLVGNVHKSSKSENNDELTNEHIFNFNILLTNLKLLDFNTKFAKEFSNLNKDSFNKANAGLMCAIIYFLINKYNKTNENNENNENNSAIEINNKFSFCFPTTTLKELKDFKEIAFAEILKIINPNNNEEILPKFNKSLLDSACGERLIYLLRTLSDKVLNNEIIKLKLKKTSTNTNNNNTFSEFFIPSTITPTQKSSLLNLFKSKEYSEWKKKAKAVNIISQKDKLVENSKRVCQVQSDWGKFASHIENEQSKLEKEKLCLQKKYKNFKEKENDASIYTEIAGLDRAPKLENHKMFREMVGKLNSQLEDKSEFINNLEFIASESQIYDNFSLDSVIAGNAVNAGTTGTSGIFDKEKTKEEEEEEEVLFLHEKVVNYNKLIENSINSINSFNVQNLPQNKQASSLNEINEILKNVITSNSGVLNKIDNLINELENKI